MKAKLMILGLLLAFAFTSCDKDEDHPAASGDGKVEFYKLDKEVRVANACQIDTARSTLQATPIVSNDEIRSYDPGTHEFRLSDAAWKRLDTLPDWAPLALTLNGRIVYAFFHKPTYSSSTCFESITMQLRPKLSGFTAEATVRISLGYPVNYANIEDKRNDAALLAELRAQRKLR